MLESELYQLLEGTADAAFVVDGNGLTVSWNRAAEKLFGYPASEVLGKSCAELLQGYGALGTLVCTDRCDVLECAAAHREVPNFDLEVKTRPGQRLWVNVSIVEYHNPRTHRHFAIHLVRDIRKRRETEERSHKLMQAARELVILSISAEQMSPVSPLTSQEIRVLQLLASGKGPHEVARELKITGPTLRNHLHHVNQKLRTKNRLEAVIHAIRRGLI